MEDKDKAISKLADMVISWQKMYNTNLKQMEKIDGKERLRVIISEKQDIIDGTLGRHEENAELDTELEDTYLKLKILEGKVISWYQQKPNPEFSKFFNIRTSTKFVGFNTDKE